MKKQALIGLVMMAVYVAAMTAVLWATVVILSIVDGVSLPVSDALIWSLWIMNSVAAFGLCVKKLSAAKFWRVWLLKWKYRHIDKNLCCCGQYMTGNMELDSICKHGGCYSMREHAIKQELFSGNPNYNPYANR